MTAGTGLGVGSSAATNALLAVSHVTVRFGGLVAVNDVSIDVPVGQVTGLIGPNGAGKTTLFNVISGLQSPTQGTVTLGVVDITKWTAARRARAGIARTFQRLEVFGSLSVRDNVLTAAELSRGWHRVARGMVETDIGVMLVIDLAAMITGPAEKKAA